MRAKAQAAGNLKSTAEIKVVQESPQTIVIQPANLQGSVYTKYTGPERRNMPEGGGQEAFNVWNVFPEWQTSCPRATELAEVFALGRTIWMLLQFQNDNDFGEVEHPNDVQVTWSDGTNIPSPRIRDD